VKSVGAKDNHLLIKKDLMNNVTSYLEDSIENVASQLLEINDTVSDIYKVYFSTSASTLVGALASDSTPATVSSKLTKGKFINGITMCENIINFINNQAVATSDYLATSENLINGSDQASQSLSQDVESIGTRLQNLGGTLITLNQTVSSLLNLYNAAQLSAVLTAISGDPVVIGCSTTKTKFLSGVTLLQQFNNLMNNSAVTTGDYLSTISQWNQGF
jgi:hypothetical protein